MYGLGMAKGLLVTLKNLTKKPFTVQYPEERVKQHPRFPGRGVCLVRGALYPVALPAPSIALWGSSRLKPVPARPTPKRATSTAWKCSTFRFPGACSAGCVWKPAPMMPCSWGAASSRAATAGKKWLSALMTCARPTRTPAPSSAPQLEERNYDPRSGKPLDWREVGRESWPWHLKEKAGMRLTRPALPGDSEVSPDESSEDPAQAPGTDQDLLNGSPKGNAS